MESMLADMEDQWVSWQVPWHMGEYVCAVCGCITTVVARQDSHMRCSVTVGQAVQLVRSLRFLDMYRYKLLHNGAC